MKFIFVVMLFSLTQFSSASTLQSQSCELPKGSYVVLSEASIVDELGSPDDFDNFKIGEGVTEFRIELFNIYTESRVANRKVRIWERTWNRGDCRITIWFHWANGQKFSILSHGWHKDQES